MRRRGAWGTALLAGLLALEPAVAQRTDREPALEDRDVICDAEECEEEEESGEDEEFALRERLTEREDKRRPLEPWSTPVAGRPLIVGGEWETEVASLRRRVLDEEIPEREDRLFLATELVLEAFYSFGEPLSLYAEVHLIWEEDLLSNTFEEISDFYVERSEMWAYSEGIAGTPINLDIGRLDFEDDRRWWWDDELDAVRLEWEADTWDVAVALARELGPDRSDRSWVEPEDDRVLRWVAEASWDYRENHAVELFALYADDHSRRERVGDVVGFDREDDEDARLLWLGGRATGVFERPGGALFGYWLDVAWVDGKERRAEYDEITRRRSVVEETSRHDVRGWAFDVGVAYLFAIRHEPRVYVGYAYGSGDETPESGTDTTFRQTGLQGNEAGFGGVERFPSYGIVLDPELSNLGILTLGVGMALFESSSLDLVYHHYRLPEPTFELRDIRLEAPLDGRSHDLGQGLDLVLALEEWERLEFAIAAATFRTGDAFGSREGTWSYGGYVAARIAF